MNILVTGANGYIGKRLIPILISQGHNIIACVRDKTRYNYIGEGSERLEVLEIDFIDPPEQFSLPEDIDVAYYLIHSMTSEHDDFHKLEFLTAVNFVLMINKTKARQIIYLSGIVNSEKLSKHLASRKKVESILDNSTVPLTTMRAGIIVGSGSASFEIIRDLVEKLPVMITPKWLNTRCQPISIRNVIEYLVGVLLVEESYNRSFDIGGPDILTYKEMLLQFAEVRKLKRWILTVPVMTPRLSSYWLYFITSTTYKLAVHLVNSMKVEVVCQNSDIKDIVHTELIPYKNAIEHAFQRIEQNHVISSWIDAVNTGNLTSNLNSYIEVPSFGCYKDSRSVEINNDTGQVLDNIWSIGGKRGWYYANWIWRFRGFLDKLFGGVGLRRGRTNSNLIEQGDALDFWRVILADETEKRLLLFAEMKLPGEAWLEFSIKSENNSHVLRQIATFRPKGLLGRLYWIILYPFHILIFMGMIKNIEKYSPD